MKSFASEIYFQEKVIGEPVMLTYRTTIEVLDRTLTVDIRYAICPAEPMVRYYSDGSGYPGAPAYIEDFEVTVVEVDGEPASNYGGGFLTSITEEATASVERSIGDHDSLEEALWENANDENPMEDYPWE